MQKSLTNFQVIYRSPSLCGDFVIQLKPYGKSFALYTPRKVHYTLCSKVKHHLNRVLKPANNNVKCETHPLPKVDDALAQ